MRLHRTNRRRPIYRDCTKPRTDPDLTAEWVDKRIRPGLMIQEDDGTLRPIGMVEAWKTYSKWRQRKIDEEREQNGMESE